MAKNAYLLKLQREKAAAVAVERRNAIDFTMQFAYDAAAIAANKVFHRRGGIIVEFLREMQEAAMGIAHMTLEDSADDKGFVYTKDTVDRQLEYILGEKFQPWDERYDWCGGNDVK